MPATIFTAFAAAAQQQKYNRELRVLLGDHKASVRRDIGHSTEEIQAMIASPVVVFFKNAFTTTQRSDAFAGQVVKA